MRIKRRKTSKKAKIWLGLGIALGGLSVVPFLLTYDYEVKSVDASGNIISWGVGINNWGTREGVNPKTNKEEVVNLRKDMYLKEGGGLFGSANYPTNYFKYHQYIEQCSKFDNKDAVYNTKELAQEVLNKSNEVMVFLYIGTATAALAGLIIIVSLNMIFLRWKYRLNDNNPTRAEVERYYESVDDEETFFVNYRGN